MKQFIYSIILLLLLVSCNRMKDKGVELKDRVENKFKRESEELADKMAPNFDAYEPDTKFNKKRFKEFLEVDLTPDVKNIYCFDDAIGIDADYQFSFNCNPGTAQKIIKKLELTPDKIHMDVSGLQHDFDWWDKKKVEKLDLYSWKGESEYYKYFWYDQKEQKAYYFEFDM
jgi:hypothetical protein